MRSDKINRFTYRYTDSQQGHKGGIWKTKIETIFDGIEMPNYAPNYLNLRRTYGHNGTGIK